MYFIIKECICLSYSMNAYNIIRKPISFKNIVVKIRMNMNILCNAALPVI